MDRAYVRAPLAVLALATHLAACGGGAPSTPTAPAPLPSLGAVDAALVGVWSGTVDGSFGPGSFSMTLSATGSMNAAGSGSYCSSTGEWGCPPASSGSGLETAPAPS